MHKEPEEELPIMKYRDEIVEKVRKNPVTIIFGGKTGCGKSTKIPQFIMDDCKKETFRMLVTQPKKIAAMRLARRVSSERKCELGSNVGYQVGLKKKLDGENHSTKLLYCTTGVVIEKIIYQKNIAHYSHIILDEIHERDIEIDLLMNIVREFLIIGSADTKLILMSATFDANKFNEYFTLRENREEYKPAIVSIETERKFSIDIQYLDDLSLTMSEKIINYSVPSITSEMYHLAAKVIKNHLHESTKSILVFLPGIYEIESAHAVLMKDDDVRDNCLIVILHSSLPIDQQNEAFMRSTLPKVILSTNIAESSVTIPDVEYVVDFCLAKNIVCESGSSMSLLKLEFASQNSCIQRAGRTGRVCDGKVTRLIHRRFYKHTMLPENIPEMQRAPLEAVVLRIKALEDAIPPIPFLNKCLSPPDPRAVRASILKLKELGGLKLMDDDSFNPNDGKLTFVGKIMAALPIDVQLSKLIVLGFMFSILDEIIIIAAGLSIKNIFKMNYNKKLEDFNMKTRWSNGSGCDAITCLNAYKFWQHEREKGTISSYEKEQKWCNEYGLDRKNLREMNLLVMKIQDRLKQMKLEPIVGSQAISWSAQEKPIVIKFCIAGAFMPNFYVQGKSDEIDEREVYKTLIGLDPNRTVYFRKMDANQLGEIYADRIKDKLVQCEIADNKNGMKVSFDSSKVFVQFCDDRISMIDDGMYDEKQLRSASLFPGNICNEVYRAVKYRKTWARNKMIETESSKKEAHKLGQNFYNSSIQLEVLPAHETREYARDNNLLEDVRGKFHVKKLYYSYPEHVYLPGYNVKEMQGFIKHVEHCSKFYFQPVDGENLSVLGDIELSLKKEDLRVAENLYVGKLVIAYHEEYHKRARIVKIFNNTVECFMFDYGYTVDVPPSDIYELDEDLMTSYFSISERCFECRLMEIAPSYAKCPRGKWTNEAIDDFRQQVVTSFCKIQVYSVVNDVVAVKLFASKQNKNINEYLVEKGYARKVKEPYPSQLNHNERQNVQMSKTEWMTREEEFENKENTIIKRNIKPPPLEKCKTIIRLDGPYSPLETQIWSVSLKTLGNIQIDPMSVNCVTLNTEMESHHGTLLVAAEVSKSPNSGVVLHNISTLPNIFGLETLLALMFAPNVMFYADENQTRFIGLRCGLGYHESTLEAYFYDHDFYVPINYVDELESDVVDANLLRYCMSMLSKRPPTELDEKEMNGLLRDIKEVLVKLLKKNRQPVANSSFFQLRPELWKSECLENMVYTIDIHAAGPYRSIQLPKLAKKNN